MAFVDTIMSELPSATIIIVDKNAVPGGHWVHSYDYVHLHQPSLLYGVASRQLEGNWAKLMCRFTLPWNHHASKKEILTYFQSFVSDKIATGQLMYFPNSHYDFDQSVTKDGDHFTYTFSSMDDDAVPKETYCVTAKEKLVNGVLGECIIPSQTPVQFHIDKEITMLTPNELYRTYNDSKCKKNQTYVVLGAGKTAMDAVIFLQTTMTITPEKIVWVIPNDVWMLDRGGPWSLEKALLKHDGDIHKSLQALEEKNFFVRLDEEKKVTPTKFRFPVIRAHELTILRKVKRIIRKGRVTSIQQKLPVVTGDGTKNPMTVHFDGGGVKGKESSELFGSSDDYSYIHCTSPGAFYGSRPIDVFHSDHQLDLFPIFPPPISISLSSIAYLEAARKKGRLDIEFARKVYRALMSEDDKGIKKDASIDDILKCVIQPFEFNADIDPNAPTKFYSIVNLASFLAIADSDCTIVYKWLKGNRLSFVSIPKFQTHIYDQLCSMVSKSSVFGFSKSKLEQVTLLRDKLEPLKGM